MIDVHLVDGTFELFRAFFGAPPAKSPDGKEIGATRSLLRNLTNLLAQKEVTHVAYAFDHVIESFRNKLFDGYKTGEGIPKELSSQFGLVEEGVAALGVVVWPMVKFEADDALATGAKKFAKSKSVRRIFLCTPDKDLAQCIVTTKIVSWDRVREKILDEKGVKKKFGVSPNSIPDWLAMVGDTADGIPGIPKWGAKSASQILSKYQHVEKIPTDPEKWRVKLRGAQGLAEVLNANRKEVKLYRTLATLRTDVPLKEGLRDLEWRGADRKRLARLAKKIGEKNLPQRITRFRD